MFVFVPYEITLFASCLNLLQGSILHVAHVNSTVNCEFVAIIRLCTFGT